MHLLLPFIKQNLFSSWYPCIHFVFPHLQACGTSSVPLRMTCIRQISSLYLLQLYRRLFLVFLFHPFIFSCTGQLLTHRLHLIQTDSSITGYFNPVSSSTILMAFRGHTEKQAVQQQQYSLLLYSTGISLLLTIFISPRLSLISASLFYGFFYLSSASKAAWPDSCYTFSTHLKKTLYPNPAGNFRCHLIF